MYGFLYFCYNKIILISFIGFILFLIFAILNTWEFPLQNNLSGGNCSQVCVCVWWFRVVLYLVRRLEFLSEVKMFLLKRNSISNQYGWKLIALNIMCTNGNHVFMKKTKKFGISSNLCETESKKEIFMFMYIAVFLLSILYLWTEKFWT